MDIQGNWQGRYSYTEGYTSDFRAQPEVFSLDLIASGGGLLFRSLYRSADPTAPWPKSYRGRYI